MIDESDSMWCLYETGKPIDLTHEDFVRLTSDADEDEPIPAAMEAARFFNERIRESNGIRTYGVAVSATANNREKEGTELP